MRQALAALALLPLFARGARACAVCFGRASGAQGLLDGIWWGIVLLLAVTMSLVASVGWLLWTVEKNRLAAEARR